MSQQILFHSHSPSRFSRSTISMSSSQSQASKSRCWKRHEIINNSEQCNYCGWSRWQWSWRWPPRTRACQPIIKWKYRHLRCWGGGKDRSATHWPGGAPTADHYYHYLIMLLLSLCHHYTPVVNRSQLEKVTEVSVSLPFNVIDNDQESFS